MIASICSLVVQLFLRASERAAAAAFLDNALRLLAYGLAQEQRASLELTSNLNASESFPTQASKLE